MPQLDLTSGAQPVLSMRIWSDAYIADGTTLEAFVPATNTWTVLSPYSTMVPYNVSDIPVVSNGWGDVGAPIAGAYQLTAFDLTAYVGGTAQLRLAFRSNNNGYKSGMYIDEIRVDEEDSDPDGDGIIGIIAEYNIVGHVGLDPFLADSDGDGVNDGDELSAGFNPLDPLSHGNRAPQFTGAPAIAQAVAYPGDTLTLTGTGTSDADGDTVTLSYQWKANAVNVATTSTYTVPAGDAGKAITCVVTANDGSGSANATTVAPETAALIVSATPPSISIADASVIEGSSFGTTSLNLTVSLSASSASDVSVDYATSDGTALSTSDYTAVTATLTIAAGSTTGTITVLVNADSDNEPDETLTVTLSNPVNATIATASATGTIQNDDAGINDTGITLWGDATRNSLTSTQAAYPMQDADTGRDANPALNSGADGRAGFSFTKLDASGVALAGSAATWSCVQDNVTGLIWEVKTTAGGGGLHDASNVYAWTNTFAAQVNTAGLCGYSDWRMPTKEELRSIVDYGSAQSVDAAYFPNTVGADYWTSVQFEAGPASAWSVNFNTGNDGLPAKTSSVRIRLVR
jgi:hypothetical protein